MPHMLTKMPRMEMKMPWIYTKMLGMQTKILRIYQIKINQIKSFIRPQVNNIHINKNDYTITYIYFVAGELQDSSGCFHTSSPGSEK